MTDNTQPEALRLADAIKASGQFTNLHTLDEASAELLRQHARIAELEAQLEAVGAGGVQALSAAPAIKPLEWSSESAPNEKIRYNHITAETALGQFSVEWKGWKADDSPCVYLAGEYIGCTFNLDAAKQLAERHIREIATALLAASPTPPAEQAAPKTAPQQEAQKPATVPRFNCWSTNEGDSWFDHPADSQAIYDCLGDDAKVGDEYELTAGWTSVTARYRITEVVGDGEEYEVECVSHPHENSAPQPAPAPLSRDQIREVFMAHGFTIKEGQTDLKQYVYDAAHALLGTKPAPLSDDVVRGAAFEAVRKKLCALPRFSFFSDGYGAIRRVPDKSGSWIAFDAAHALFDPVAVDAALASQGGK